MSLVDEDDHGGTRDVAQGSKLVLRTGVDSREEVRKGDRWVFTVCACALSVLGERGSRDLRCEGHDLLVGHADEEVVEGPCQVCRLVQFVRCVYDLAVHVDEEGLRSSFLCDAEIHRRAIRRSAYIGRFKTAMILLA